MSDLELREICKNFAINYVVKQKEQFKRLGILADWENPYITLKPEYEAEQIRTFAHMASKKGTIYRGLRPVHWCPSCETALAEAELEYKTDKCRSIFVKFRLTNDKGVLDKMGADVKNTYFIIWTTTAWTLPANLAICVGKDFEYSIIKNENEFYIVADSLKENVMAAGNIENYEEENNEETNGTYNVVNTIRDLAMDLESFGYRINIDENETETSYLINIEVEK